MAPLYIYNQDVRSIKGHQRIERIYAFQKFTIPDDKRVRIMAGEINGGRALVWNLDNSDIMNASTL